MILWTLQPFSWWTILKKNGKITADLAKIESDPNAFYEDRYNYAYGWLVEEMKQSIPPASETSLLDFVPHTRVQAQGVSENSQYLRKPVQNR